MSIDRRKVLALLASGAATALAGCGGGGDNGPYQAPPTRFVWLLNLNPEFQTADVTFGATTVTLGLPFPLLTPRIEVEYGVYSVALRDPRDGFTLIFNGILIDANSPSVFVFYRRGDSAEFAPAPLGIVNYFDSAVPLDVDLFGAGNQGQLVDALPFEGVVQQASNSFDCELDLFAAGDPRLVYNSGVQSRTDSVIVFPRFPAGRPDSGQVAVVGLNFGFSSGLATAVIWPNTLG